MAYDTYNPQKSTIAYVGRAFWFNVQDIPEANLFYGLVDGDGTAKPARDVYRDYANY